MTIISDKKNFIKQAKKPKISDIELIALNLTAEYMGIDSENHFFRQLKNTCLTPSFNRAVPSLIEEKET